jgi:uncharacterized protein involved in outer membrane biogenesis
MRIKTILIILVAVILTAVVAVAVILKSMDFNEYRDQIAESISETTGRELKIDGELKVKLSFVPSLAVNNITFANASWGSRPEMAKIKRLEVQVDLLPLISGEIKVNRFVLIEPDILLETDKQGRGNWIIGKKEKASAKLGPATKTGKQDAIIPLVKEVHIKKALLTYRDGRTDKQINLSLKNFRTRSADMQSPFYMDIDGAYNNNRFEIIAELGPLNHLINPSQPYPIKLEGQYVGTTINMDGTVKIPMKGKGLDLSFSAKGEELTKLVKLAELSQLKGKKVPQIGSFDITAKIAETGGIISVTDIKASAGKQDLTLVEVKGVVKDAMKGKGINLTIFARGEELTKLVKLAELPQLKGKKVPQIGPFDIATHIADSGEKLSVTDITITAGKNDLSLFKVRGVIKDVIKGKGLALAISAKGKELTKLLELAEIPQLKGKAVPQIGSFDVAANVTGPVGKLSVTDIKVTVGRNDLFLYTMKGAIKDAMNGKGLDLTVSAKGDELGKLVELAELPQLKGKRVSQIGPFDVSAHVMDPGKKLSLADIKVALGDEDFAIVKMEGAVNDVSEGKGLNLKLSATGPDLGRVSKLADVELPLDGSFNIAALLTDNKDTFSLKDLNLQLGRSHLAGVAAVKISGDRPLLNVSLTSLNIDLNEFKKKSTDKKPEGKKISDKNVKSQKKVFSSAPFPLEGLQMVNARIKMAKGSVLSNGLQLTNLSLDMTLKEGNLSIHPVKGSLAKGNFSAVISLDASQQKKAALNAKMNFNKIAVSNLLKDMKLTNLVSAGKINMKADLEGKGNSVQTLMAGLSGKVSLTMGKGKIENKYVDIIAADLINLIVPGGMKKDYTAVNCFVSRFDIKNGLATNNGFLFDTDNITVAGDGNIDLSTEKLNLVLKPKPKKASLISLAIPLNIRGTLAEPSIRPDTASVAKKVAGSILGSLINPAAILVPLVSKGTKDKNSCIEALKKSKKSAGDPSSKQKTSKSVKKQKEKKPEDIQDVLEGIGKGLGGLFK